MTHQIEKVRRKFGIWLRGYLGDKKRMGKKFECATQKWDSYSSDIAPGLGDNRKNWALREYVEPKDTCLCLGNLLKVLNFFLKEKTFFVVKQQEH